MNIQQENNRLIDLLDARADRLLYTYRTQEKAADRYEKYENRRKRISVFLTVLTTTTFIVSILGLLLDEVWGNLIVSFLALLATLASTTGEIMGFQSKINEHKLAGVEVRLLHQKYESLITDLESNLITNEKAILMRDELQNEEKEVLKTCPRTTRKDYECASKGIVGDEKPVSDKSEINQRTPGRNDEKEGEAK